MSELVRIEQSCGTKCIECVRDLVSFMLFREMRKQKEDYVAPPASSGQTPIDFMVESLGDLPDETITTLARDNAVMNSHL